MKRSKHVLLIPEFSSFGGTREYFLLLLEYFHNEQIPLTVFLSKKQLDSGIYESIKENQINVIRLSCEFGIQREIEVLLRLILFVRLKRPTEIFFSSGSYGNFLLAQILYKHPRVYTFYHSYPQSKVPRFLRRIFVKLLVNVNKVTVSNASAFFFRERIFTMETPVAVLHSTLRCRMEGVLLREKSTYRIVTFGHLEVYKNPDLWLKTAIAVLHDNPNLDITFHWYGEGSLEADLKNRITLKDKIQVHKPLANVHEVLKGCFAYLQTSNVESFGLSVLHAQKHGIPVVVTKTGGLPEIINLTRGGLVCDQNPEALSKAISKLLKDKDLYKSLSLRAAEGYKSNFSWTRWKSALDLLRNEVG